MKIFISTSSHYKEKELSKYFKDIGLTTTHIKPEELELLQSIDTDYLCVREQTTLIDKSSKKQADYKKFGEVIHSSNVTANIKKDGIEKQYDFSASVEGFIFPHLKTDRSDVYNWDDVFVSTRTMKTYQAMKDKGIKNSARDIAFSKLIDELPFIFEFEKKVNLKFNPTETNEVISFKPFIYDLFQENRYYQIAYKNPLFKNIINNVLNEGLFIRRASNRKQKNYWLPGLNAGIPLTPKKDELHEMTFMFHDIMHFIFTDVMVLDNDKISKHKYLISRMMSEAFTLVLADMLFVSLLKDENIEYDYNKRRIYPLFDKMKFSIDKDNISKIKDLLWANVCFALLGREDELFALVNDQELINSYKEKYQRFFQEDYRWTHHNYENVVKKSNNNTALISLVTEFCKDSIPTTHNFCSYFDVNAGLEDQIKSIFDCMFGKLKLVIETEIDYNPTMAFTHAVKRYFVGQMSVFFKFETLYNDLFITQLMNYLKKETLSEDDLIDLNTIYSVYIDKLKEDNYISQYTAKDLKNICPIFDPFYVFYEKKENETFAETLNDIFKEDK
jgi:inosine/xanthosine triphosphate pyrophosphatase family protein